MASIERPMTENVSQLQGEVSVSFITFLGLVNNHGTRGIRRMLFLGLFRFFLVLSISSM